MIKLSDFIDIEDLKFIEHKELIWLQGIFERFNGFPTLENLWKIMDEIWYEYNCDPKNLDSRVDNFYSHPVWLLSGLFAEQHQLSLVNRQIFTKWASAKKPKRVADFGGGFGSLARMIAESCPDTFVEVIEPHPHKLAIEKSKEFNNLSYKNNLEGEYDILIATDVFEHVSDPLGLVAETSMFLKKEGFYLIANHFQPIIKCHLPQSYHLYYSFNYALEAMNFKIIEKIIYGTVFKLYQKLNLDGARKIEKKSKRLWFFTKYLHRRIESTIVKFIF
jgi:ubiquinone/menaquinone biosynthesis C-methylase UbiE